MSSRLLCGVLGSTARLKFLSTRGNYGSLFAAADNRKRFSTKKTFSQEVVETDYTKLFFTGEGASKDQQPVQAQCSEKGQDLSAGKETAENPNQSRDQDQCQEKTESVPPLLADASQSAKTASGNLSSPQLFLPKAGISSRNAVKLLEPGLPVGAARKPQVTPKAPSSGDRATSGKPEHPWNWYATVRARRLTPERHQGRLVRTLGGVIVLVCGGGVLLYWTRGDKRDAVSAFLATPLTWISSLRSQPQVSRQSLTYQIYVQFSSDSFVGCFPF